MKKIIALLIICTSIFRLYGTIPLEPNGTVVHYNVTHSPEFLLPSTETISRIKSVVRPTGLSTGIPDISVPLFTNKFTNYYIGLSYHAQGIQVNEEASCVGLGWNLEVGGVIARVVRGIPDDIDGGYLYLSDDLKTLYNTEINLLDNTSSNDLYSIGANYDAAPDIFYYNFSGMKGKFVFDTDGTITSIPHNNLKIEKFTFNNEIIAFKIYTPNGMKYTFNKSERINYTSGSTSFSYNSAWYLSTVNSFSKLYANYMYEDVTENKTRNLYDFRYYDHEGSVQEGTVTASLEITRPQLISIQDDVSRTTFVYGVNNRMESINVRAVNYNKLNEYINPIEEEQADRDLLENHDITGIHILESYEPYTIIEFNYGNFPFDDSEATLNTELRNRKLTSVTLGQASKKTYSFGYDETPIPGLNSKQQDLWGYYKNSGNATFLPHLNYSSGVYESFNLSSGGDIVGVDRTVNEVALKAGILTSIENPLGGVVQYYYEPQKFVKSNGEEVIGGGLRIKEIKTTDLKSVHPEKTISYFYTNFDDGTPTGVLVGKPNFAYFLDNQYETIIKFDTYHYSNYAYGISGYYSNPVFYKQVTTTDGGTGYTVIDFEMPVSNQYFYSTEVKNTNFLFHREPLVDVDGDQTKFTKISYLGKDYLEYFTYDWNTIYISKETYYDYSDKKEVKEVIYTYNDIEDPMTISGFFTSPKLFKVITDEIITNDNLTCELNKFYYCPSWKLLTSTETITYENVKEFSTINSVEYDLPSSKYRFPIRTETIDVNGNIHFKEVKYPYHYEYSDWLNDLIVEYENSLIIPFDDYVLESEGELIFRKRIPVGIIPDPQDEIKSAEEYRVGIETMKARGIVNRPIEIINGIETATIKEILSARLNLYKKTGNDDVGLHEQLIYEGPTDYDSFTKSLIDTSFHYYNEYRTLSRSLYSIYGARIGDMSASGIKTYYKYTVIGGYLIAKAINTDYKVIEDYKGDDTDIGLRAGENIVSTYDYKPLVGKIRETDARGRSVYYIYNTDGNLIATKDHDKYVRSINSQHLANATNESITDIFTDPDKEDFMNTDAGTLNVSTNGGCGSVDYSINGYKPSLKYILDFGDGTVQEVTSSEKINHIYTVTGLYNVSLKILKNEHLIEEQTQQVSLTYSEMDVQFSTHTETLEWTLTADIENGSGEYTVLWEVIINGVDPPHTPIPEAVSEKCTATVSRTFGTTGEYKQYVVTCTVSDGGDTPAVKTWSFNLGDPI